MKNLPAYSFAIFAYFVFMIIFSGKLLAKPVNSEQVEKAVNGWLKTDAKPLGMQLCQKIKKTEVFKGIDGQPAYYIVSLDPVGFVIVSADDQAEPIIGFANGDEYEQSNDNPLGSLVSSDLPKRVAALRKLEARLAGGVQKKDLSSDEVIFQQASDKSKKKWDKLAASADSIQPMGVSGISDIRVAPLVQSQWDQGFVCDNLLCYNYYTPNNYSCGCAATAMAQLMRYWQWPISGIGVQGFSIHANGKWQTVYTRGGDGNGGPYNWSQIMLVPDCTITDVQRQAIGALCYDAGISVNMVYSGAGGSANAYKPKDALVNTFMYSNAIAGHGANILAGLNGMLNPNLDSGYPVILGVYGSGVGHATVADGYGYNSSTLYHHLNLGWGGLSDAWYNLPNVDSSPYDFNSVESCIYNIYVSGTGEIISGRVVDASGNPISGAAVTANWSGGSYTTTTRGNGIYALAKVYSGITYSITVTANGYSFISQSVRTGTSADAQSTSGNKWGVNFQGMSPDLNKDGKVDMFDYAILASQWQQAPGVTSADISPPGGDGVVDFKDLAVMAGEWLTGISP